MKTVQIYIKDQITGEYNRLDLFKDEKISITSSIQNINDISKTYSDFSQTFTVPASVNNNLIFKHWYENANDYGFSTLTKSDAYIEIDTITFRQGKIELTSVKMTDGKPENYSITFIGSLGNLKDKFNGLSLKDINTGSYITYSYTPTGVKNSVTTTAISTDIMWPLISSDKYWFYGTSSITNSQNINLATKPIYFNELFPAIRLSTMFDIIANRFDINFTGDFLTEKRFTNAYLWLKNADTFETKAIKQIAFDNYTTSFFPLNTYTTIDYTTNVITTQKATTTNYENNFTQYKLSLQFTSTNIPYTLIVYKNNIEYSRLNLNSSTSNTQILFLTESNINQVNTYSFFIESNQLATFYNVNLQCDAGIMLRGIGGGGKSGGSPGFFDISTRVIFTQTTSNQTLISNLNLDGYMPNIKIEDFFTGILKMFNLTCFSEDAVTYTIEQLELYYLNGQIKDFTEYIESDSNNINKVTTYSRINFEYEKSESIINKAYVDKNEKEYGTYKDETYFEGVEYSIKLPFEDLSFNRFMITATVSTNLQVGYALKTDYQKYIPKAVILYDYNNSSLTAAGGTYYFSTGLSSVAGTGSAYTNYKAFGQETTFKKYGVTGSFGLNFPSQQSTLTNEVIDAGLYNQYYQTYLSNSFTPKARLLKVNAILPTSILTSIRLSDRIVIRDKRYVINTMTSDITNGKTQFELLTDFREIPADYLITTLIGTQSWSIKNLDITSYRNGDPIPQITSATAWAGATYGAWCYYNNVEENGTKYGKLYNWYAVNDARGLAPVGYHIPSITEWSTLYTAVGGSSIAGTKLKQSGNKNWPVPSLSSDEYDFTALPTGWREPSGAFSDFPNYGNYQSSTSETTATAWHAYFFYNNNRAFQNYVDKRFGMAVRLIAD